MKATVFHGPRDVRIESVPDPRIAAPNEAIVRITRAAICGSDMHSYHGRDQMMPGFVLGHEGIGIVEETGPAVTRIRKGQRVVIACVVSCGECLLLPARPALAMLRDRLRGFRISEKTRPASWATSADASPKRSACPSRTTRCIRFQTALPTSRRSFAGHPADRFFRRTQWRHSARRYRRNLRMRAGGIVRGARSWTLRSVRDHRD